VRVVKRRVSRSSAVIFGALDVMLGANVTAVRGRSPLGRDLRPLPAAITGATVEAHDRTETLPGYIGARA